MNPKIRERYTARLEDMFARLQVRNWEFRQRRRAKGVWFRFRRALAGAEFIYRVSAQDADFLIAEGCRVDPVGSELHPNKRLIWCPASRVARLSSAEQLAPRMDGPLLASPDLVLVAFA